MIDALLVEASALRGAEMFQQHSGQGSATGDGSTLKGVCEVVAGLCLRVEHLDVRRARQAAKDDEQRRGIVSRLMEDLVCQVEKLAALPQGTCLWEGLPMQVIDSFRVVCDFLFHWSDQLIPLGSPLAMLLSNPQLLMDAMQMEQPPRLVAELHMRLLQVRSVVTQGGSTSVIDELTWPEMLRETLEANLVSRARAILMERLELGQIIKFPRPKESAPAAAVAACATAASTAAAAGETPGGDETGGGLGRGCDDDKEAGEQVDAPQLMGAVNISDLDSKTLLSLFAEPFAEDLELLSQLASRGYEHISPQRRWELLRALVDGLAEEEGGMVRMELEKRQARARDFDVVLARNESEQAQALPLEMQQVTIRPSTARASHCQLLPSHCQRVPLAGASSPALLPPTRRHFPFSPANTTRSMSLCAGIAVTIPGSSTGPGLSPVAPPPA